MKKELVYRTFTNPPELHTLRLTLRRMMVTDTADLYEYASRQDVTRYLTWYAHPDRDYSREYLQYIAGRYRAGMFYDWAIVYEAEGKMIGTCGFTAFDCASDSAEIGYVLNPDYWGRGIATEAVLAVLKFGFETLHLHRIEAKFMKGNEASKRVMEKVGMTFEGIHRGERLVKGNYVDVGVSAILFDEWKERQNKE